MKYTRLFMMLLFLPAVVTSCGLLADPVTYNDKIIRHQMEVSQAIKELYAAYDESDLTTVEALRTTAHEKAATAVKEVSAMKPFRGNSEFRDASADLFKLYERYLEQDMKEFNELYYKEDPTETDDMRMVEISDGFEKEEEVLHQKMLVAQQAFADKYNMPLKYKNQ